MNAVIIAAVLAKLKQMIIAAIESKKADLPDTLKAFADQVAIWIGNLIDSIDLATLEADIAGRLLELVRTGKGPSSSASSDTA